MKMEKKKTISTEKEARPERVPAGLTKRLYEFKPICSQYHLTDLRSYNFNLISHLFISPPKQKGEEEPEEQEEGGKGVLIYE